MGGLRPRVGALRQLLPPARLPAACLPARLAACLRAFPLTFLSAWLLTQPLGCLRCFNPTSPPCLLSWAPAWGPHLSCLSLHRHPAPHPRTSSAPPLPLTLTLHASFSKAMVFTTLFI